MALFGKSRKTSRAASSSAAGPSSQVSAGEASNKRRAERFSTAVITCLLGEVQDLSATGMRVASRQKPPVPVGLPFEFEVCSPTDELTVVGRIVRIQKRKPAGFDIGIEFQNVKPETAAALESLARHGCIKARGQAARAGAASSPGGAVSGVTARMDLPDLYAVLGLAEGASEENITRAFREHARRCHPDVNPSAEAHARFIEIQKAYEVLRDPDKRTAYNTARARPAA